MKHNISQLGKIILDLFFPRHCVSCKKLSGGAPLCQGCREQLKALASPGISPHEQEGLDAVMACYAYQGVGGALMRAFKFRRQNDCYDDLLRPLFEETVLKYYQSYTFDMILPIPASKRTMRERGFNQAEYIAQRLSKAMGIPCNGKLLYKAHTNAQQHHLPAQRRKENVYGVFALFDVQAAAHKRVLLIDDICTTGATLCEAARVLREAGASQVCAAAVLYTEALPAQAASEPE